MNFRILQEELEEVDREGDTQLPPTTHLDQEWIRGADSSLTSQCCCWTYSVGFFYARKTTEVEALSFPPFKSRHFLSACPQWDVQETSNVYYVMSHLTSIKRS